MIFKKDQAKIFRHFFLNLENYVSRVWFMRLTKFKIFLFLSFFLFANNKINPSAARELDYISVWFESVVDGKEHHSLKPEISLNETDKSRYARRKEGEWLWLTTLAPDSHCHDPWTTKSMANNAVDDFNVALANFFVKN